MVHPKIFTIAYFEATLYFSRTEFILAHNNITISYYRHVNSLRLKLSVALKWASNTYRGTIYFAVGGTCTDTLNVFLVM